MRKNSVGIQTITEFKPLFQGENNRTLVITGQNILGSTILIKFLLILIAFVFILIFFAWTRVKCTTLKYELVKADQVYRNLLNLNKKLKLKREMLKSSERLTNIAVRELGLAYPNQNQIVIKKLKKLEETGEKFGN